MKKLLIIAVIFLSGCSTLSNITTLWPKPHDPVMFDNLVSTKIAVEKLNCDDKNWADAESKIEHLKMYSQLRKDPQATSIEQLQEAIGKAKSSNNKLFCESILKINKARIDVVVDAWKGR
jgi:hypothetical protein